MKGSDYKKNPSAIQKYSDRQFSRKQFIKTMLTGTALASLTLKTAAIPFDFKGQVFTDEQARVLESVQEILFPNDKNGPGAADINARKYLEWVLSDKEMDKEVIQYILNGIGWVNETSHEVFSENYVELTQQQKEQLIKKISLEGWGENWLSVILSYIFEALLCDPKYGGNPDDIGWNWLKHIPGQPRPTKDLLYPEILITVKHS